MNPELGWDGDLQKRIVDGLWEHSPAGARTEAQLASAIGTMLKRPGKLLRSRLALATALAHDVDAADAVRLAVAIEYYHIASLILDDLPCMDDAKTRRGRACLHRTHGQATAVLAALAFINRAYALVGFAFARQPGAVRLEAQVCLDSSLGAAGLVGGQARDLAFADGEGSVREVSRIALGKTGALVWLALVLPALLANTSRRERRALEALCIYWSLAFQAIDDVQDVLATSVVAGKSTGRDRLLQRPNLAIAASLPEARRRIRRLMAQAERRIEVLTAVRGEWRYLEAFHRYFAEAAAPVAGSPAVIAA